MAARLMEVLSREFDFPGGEAFVTASLGDGPRHGSRGRRPRD